MENKHIIVAAVGGEEDAIFLSIKEFHAEQVILICEKEYAKEAERIKRDLERFKISCRIEMMKGPVWEEIFRIIRATVEQAPEHSEVIINVASGRGLMNCASTSAAFVNGLKAFGVNDKGEVMLLPVLKFNYYTLLSDRKMKLLKILADRDCCSSLEELAERARMSLSLVSYHINGNLKSDGLLQLGLVETKEQNRRVHVELTTMGKLLLKGYV